MKIKNLYWTLFVFSFIFLLFGNRVEAHPGNTASDGCHYCRTNCDKWGVPWNERHCHGNPSDSSTSSTTNTGTANNVANPTQMPYVPPTSIPTQIPTRIPTSKPIPTKTPTPTITLTATPTEEPTPTVTSQTTPVKEVKSATTQNNIFTGLFNFFFWVIGLK